MKTLKYLLAMLLSVVTLVLPIVGFLIIVLGGQFGLSDYKIFAYFMVATALLIPVVAKFRQNARYDAQSDEFGMTSRRDYAKMSKQERRAFDMQRQLQMETILSSTALKQMTHKGPADPDKEMENLIGLTSVKQRMKEIVARARYDRQERKKSGYNGHFVFYGNPGTGKTTVARIMASFLKDAGCIKENKIIECDGNTLRGSAPGEGSQKADILIKKAMGGILFIDEAYGMQDTCGSEAIQTIIKQMEDKRGKFVLIMAGYTNEMNRLLDQNPGFQSRVTDYLVFEDYNDMESCEIFRKMAENEGFYVTHEAMEVFTERLHKERRSKSFGNARTIRNILNESIDKHALNMAEGRTKKSDRYKLDAEDIPPTGRKIF